MGGICANAYAAPASDVGKWFKADQPIKDAQGRIRYIVLLEDIELAESITKFKDAKDALDWKSTRSAEYINALAKSKSSELVVLSTTSLAVPTFTAYLTEKQAKDLAKDKNVISMTEDRYEKTSSQWVDTIGPGTQTRSWGLSAVGNAYPNPSNGSATVYVIDLGVQGHSDLPSINPSTQLHGNNMINSVPGRPSTILLAAGLTRPMLLA